MGGNLALSGVGGARALVDAAGCDLGKTVPKPSPDGAARRALDDMVRPSGSACVSGVVRQRKSKHERMSLSRAESETTWGNHHLHLPHSPAQTGRLKIPTP